jgi:hypothetical protein
MFLGFELSEVENEYNKIFEHSTFRMANEGTVVIYPKPDWIKKFNSKKRYDLLMGAKKGVEIEFIHNDKEFGSPERKKQIITALYDMMVFTLGRHQTRFTIFPREKFERIFEHMDYILVLAKHEEEPITFNLSLYNTNKTRVERLYAGSNEKGLKMRAPSLMEMHMVEYLTSIGITYYDMWGINTKDYVGVTEFKKSLGDELLLFPPYYSGIYVHKTLAKLTEKLLLITIQIKYIINKYSH